MKNYYEVLNVKKRDPKSVIDWSYAVKSSQINSGSVNLAPEEIEEIIIAHSVLANRHTRKNYDRIIKKIEGIKKRQRTQKSMEEYLDMKNEIANIQVFLADTPQIGKSIIIYLFSTILFNLPLVILDLLCGIFIGDAFFYWIRSFRIYLSNALFIIGFAISIFWPDYGIISISLSLILIIWEVLALNNKFVLSRD